LSKAVLEERFEVSTVGGGIVAVAVDPAATLAVPVLGTVQRSAVQSQVASPRLTVKAVYCFYVL
jgi:hypothetical protein